jgi:phage protein D
MIRKNQYGLSPSFDIAVDSVSIDYQALNEIEIHLGENMHDMVVLHMAGLPPRASADYRNKPIRIQLDTGASYSHEFTGYITDIRPEAKTASGLLNGSPFQEVAIVCLGASYSMRGPKAKIWDKYRLQDVASQFAVDYGFSLDVPADALIKTPLLQEGESDWQFLVRYAKALGYGVTLHGTNLHVFDPHKAISRSISFNRLFTAKSLNNQTLPAPGQITSFKATLAERNADGVYKDSVVTVQHADGFAFDVSTREIRGLGTGTARFTNRMSEHAASYDEAARIIDARAKEDYDFYATAVVMGIAGCKPGGIVDVDKYGAEVDGYWYVQNVKHSVTSGAFTTELGLAKNINDTLVPASIQAFQAPPAPKLINSEWRASRRVLNVY